MADSVEHQFLSQRVVDVLSNLAKSRLYSYTEAERRKFDFACELQRDWSRPLVGARLDFDRAGTLSTSRRYRRTTRCLDGRDP
ncbi:hypothetical protein [Nocardia brasiliensis]|uniref:hypothetical protein n=1 Tax=Nocardia brasiliensis TaxID=37326 RepID=UPI002453EE22|nr:hypothetical protein [Nocardia brasiliensis]